MYYILVYYDRAGAWLTIQIDTISFDIRFFWYDI